LSAVDLYRRYAADCLVLAAESGSSHSKAVLIDMAQSWALLGVQAEKNSHLDLVYESPPPRLRAVE
jgi:hypothetical protein